MQFTLSKCDKCRCFSELQTAVNSNAGARWGECSRKQHYCSPRIAPSNRSYLRFRVLFLESGLKLPQGFATFTTIQLLEAFSRCGVLEASCGAAGSRCCSGGLSQLAGRLSAASINPRHCRHRRCCCFPTQKSWPSAFATFSETKSPCCPNLPSSQEAWC